MIKYKFKVEVPFLDKTNNLKEVKKDAILEVTEERLQQLNAAEVGRVISAVYVEDKADKTPTKPTKQKNKKDEAVATPKAEEEETAKEGETTETEEVVEPKADESVETEPKVEE